MTKTSSRSRSYRSAQRWFPVSASISWTVIRIRRPRLADASNRVLNAELPAKVLHVGDFPRSAKDEFARDDEETWNLLSSVMAASRSVAEIALAWIVAWR